ncbi:MAG: hypothetical protein QOH47_958 [Sphingomonadales bacterium]|jgi:hypothetical protein|nr:hypothetical protein [Sphingomonadales bacterium]
MTSIVLLASLLFAQVAAAPPSIEEQRSRFERVVAEDRAFVRRRFVQAGFRPIDGLAAERRQVRQFLFEEGHFILAIPGIEIERHRSGRVTLTIIGRGATGPPVRIPAAAWRQLEARDVAVYQPPIFVPRDPGAPIPPAPRGVCHPLLVRFAAAGAQGARSASLALGCNESSRERLQAAIEAARLAVSTRAQCRFDDSDFFWSYFNCFRPPAQPWPAAER